MDLRSIDDQELPRRRVRGHVWRHLAEKCFCDATRTTIDEGVSGVRRLVIAHQCLAA